MFNVYDFSIPESDDRGFKAIVDKTFELNQEICEEFAMADLDVEYCISLITELKLDEYRAYNNWGPIILEDGTHIYYGPNSSHIGEPAYLKFVSTDETVTKQLNRQFDISIVKSFFNDDYERRWHHRYDPYWNMRHMLRTIISQSRFSKKTFEYFDAVFRKKFWIDGIPMVDHPIYGTICNY